MIERLDSSAFTPKADLNYVDTHDLYSLYEALVFKANLILVGAKGLGKSLSIAAFAGKHGIPTVTFDCSEDVRRGHLVGMYILRGAETPFVLGPLTSAIEVANETGRCILVLEEINALTPQMQKVLNAITDWRKGIEVPEAKKVFRLNTDAKLWIVGTMNTSVYGGVYQLNEDLKSRFRMLAVDYPSESAERQVIAAVCPEASKNTELINSILTLATETRQGAMDYAISTRDVVQLIEDIANVGMERALKLLLGKFEGEDLDTMQQRVKSVFRTSSRK